MRKTPVILDAEATRENRDLVEIARRNLCKAASSFPPGASVPLQPVTPLDEDR